MYHNNFYSITLNILMTYSSCLSNSSFSIVSNLTSLFKWVTCIGAVVKKRYFCCYYLIPGCSMNKFEVSVVYNNCNKLHLNSAGTEDGIPHSEQGAGWQRSGYSSSTHSAWHPSNNKAQHLWRAQWSQYIGSSKNLAAAKPWICSLHR